MATVLATEYKVREFNLDKQQWIFKGERFFNGDKIRSTPSFGGEVKSSVQRPKILRHVKNSLEV
jgi:hypothetical protein